MGRGPTTYPQKLANCLRQATSDIPGEAIAGLRGLMRTVESNGETLHDLASRIEQQTNGGVSEADMQRVYDEGVAAGRSQAEQVQHGRRTFHDITEVKDPWGEVADFCQKRSDRLPDRENKFIKGMTGLTREKALSPKQAKWLIAIFLRLGGKL